MAERQKSLSGRREELIARSAVQREQLVALAGSIWQPGAASLHGNLLMQARKRPLLSGTIATLVFLFFRSHRLFSLFAAATLAFRTWSRWSPYIVPLLTKLKGLLRKQGNRR